MRDQLRWRLRTGAIVVCLAAAGCVSTGGAMRPSPFPGSAAPAPGPSVPRAASPSVVRTALALRGVRYHPGGDNPAAGFDCSGFVRYVFSRSRIDLPRTVTDQYKLGRSVPLAQVRAGDLLFFRTTANGASHVGIAIGPAGGDEFVHAPSTTGVVRIDHSGAAYWRTRFVGARRVL